MYPYNFTPKYLGIRHNIIFIAMPFADKYNWIYSELICPAIEECNKQLYLKERLKLEPYLAKEDPKTRSGWITILEKLTTARIVLGVLTDNNPNVFYELGIAHATQPETRQVLIAPEKYDPKFDLKDLIWFQYGADKRETEVNELAKRIIDAFHSYDIEKEKSIHKARMRIGPYGFQTMLEIGIGEKGHFAISVSDEAKQDYERSHGERSFERLLQGLSILCDQEVLALNTAKRDGDRIEFSYYWTSLGIDVLHLMGIIKVKETVDNMKSKLPTLID
jgi:hypothetical protein